MIVSTNTLLFSWKLLKNCNFYELEFRKFYYIYLWWIKTYLNLFRANKFICTACMAVSMMSFKCGEINSQASYHNKPATDIHLPFHLPSHEHEFSWILLQNWMQEIQIIKPTRMTNFFDVSGEALALAELVGNQV